MYEYMYICMNMCIYIYLSIYTHTLVFVSIQFYSPRNIVIGCHKSTGATFSFLFCLLLEPQRSTDPRS